MWHRPPGCDFTFTGAPLGDPCHIFGAVSAHRRDHQKFRPSAQPSDHVRHVDPWPLGGPFVRATLICFSMFSVFVLNAASSWPATSPTVTSWRLASASLAVNSFFAASNSSSCWFTNSSFEVLSANLDSDSSSIFVSWLFWSFSTSISLRCVAVCCLAAWRSALTLPPVTTSQPQVKTTDNRRGKQINFVVFMRNEWVVLNIGCTEDQRW